MKDTEAAATKRYVLGGFGKTGSKAAYKRYSACVELLRQKNGTAEQTINPREWVGYILTPKWRSKL